MSTRPVPPELQINADATARVLEHFIAQEVAKNGFGRVVLGLSGGVDSAVVAALCARALGTKNVGAFLLPYKSSASASARDAHSVARHLGLRPVEVDITPMAEAYFKGARFDKVRKGNILARLRMIVLFDMAKKYHALVAGTSNKTESFLGYSTWYGDSACSFQVIADLYKTQVWQLAHWLGLPEAVIRKTPSADLWPGQTDEGELGIKYLDADRILYALLDRGMRPSELVAEGYPKAHVVKVIRTIRTTQFKRQMPTVAKLSSRSIGTDFLMSRDFDPDAPL